MQANRMAIAHGKSGMVCFRSRNSSPKAPAKKMAFTATTTAPLLSSEYTRYMPTSASQLKFTQGRASPV